LPEMKPILFDLTKRLLWHRGGAKRRQKKHQPINCLQRSFCFSLHPARDKSLGFEWRNIGAAVKYQRHRHFSCGAAYIAGAVVLGETQLNRVCLRSMHYSPTWDLPLDACINHKSAAAATAVAFIATNPRTRACPLVRNYYFRLMQIANSRRAASAALILLQPARRVLPWPPRALMTTFDFSNNAAAAAWYATHGATPPRTSRERYVQLF
jgi:hypothetical protein